MRVNNSWKLGCVLQFAKCDSGKKFIKSNYVAVSSKEVGIFCFWDENFDGNDGMFQLSKESHWNPTFAQFQKMV